jgi:precorrin-6x reductase
MKKMVFRMDRKHTQLLQKAGREGAKRAIEANKALGLPVVYMERGVIYKEFADGTRQVLSPVNGEDVNRKHHVGK